MHYRVVFLIALSKIKSISNNITSTEVSIIKNIGKLNKTELFKKLIFAYIAATKTKLKKVASELNFPQ
jgi:hypothetical protein